MHDAAHIMMIVDVATGAWFIGYSNKAYIALWLEKSFKNFYDRY